MSARGVCALTLLAGVLASRLAVAQEAPALSPDAQASAWIDEGIRLRADRHDDDALALFRRAHEATRSPESLAQIALAEQALGRWVDAERDLASAAGSSADPWIARNRTHLDTALAEIRSHLGALTLRARTPRARVAVNNGDAVALPLAAPLRVEVGTVTVEVRAPGYVSARRVLEVRPQDDLLEEFDLVPERPIAPVITARVRAPYVDAPTASPQRAWATGLFFSAGVLALGGSGTWIWREVSARDFNRTGCMEDRATGVAFDGADCGSLQSQTRAATTLTVAGFVASGALTAVGVALWLAAPRSTRRAVVACAPGPLSLACAVSF